MPLLMNARRLPSPSFCPALLALAALAWLPSARAVDPAPGGGYPFANTALGDGALQLLPDYSTDNTALGYGALNRNQSVENTAVGSQALYYSYYGIGNTATGYQSLFYNSSGDFNTACGTQALCYQYYGNYNTATGFRALYYNGEGNNNTADGYDALFYNTGDDNTASGYQALYHNTTGTHGMAAGYQALQANTTGTGNTALGDAALGANTTGGSNVAVGWQSLIADVGGRSNTAVGAQSLLRVRGSHNVALGQGAGEDLTHGSNNVDIASAGAADESGTIRIGTAGKQTSAYLAGVTGVTVASGVPVVIDADGHLGVTTSSARFKEAIAPMDKSSEAILHLQPVTFHYRPELDPHGIPQFGLIAEQVAKVDPDLVARDAAGKVFTVRYEQVNAMLLNEFLKEHARVQSQQQTLASQQSNIAQLHADLTAQQQEFHAALEAQQKELHDLAAQVRPRPAP